MFGVPGMLWWGAAIAVPIMIHLFARQRYKRVAWAAMDFLLRAFKKTRKRIRLEHLLLLLLRILAILLFVLALADPRFDAGALGVGPDSRREVVVLLDDSFSMSLREADGGTPFGRSRAQAVRLIRSLRSERGDGVSLVAAGGPARALFKGVNDTNRVLAELESMEVGDGTTDLIGAFRIATALLEDLPPGVEVWLFSDLQQVGFVPPRDPALGVAAEDPEVLRPSEVLASLLQQIRARNGVVNVVAPAGDSADNVAITSLSLDSKVAVTGVATLITAVVRNVGPHVLGGTLQFYADGVGPIEQLPIDGIMPGATEARDFRHVFADAGSHVVEARFETDALAPDNTRALALDVRERIRTLVVDGDPAAESGEEESFFLTRALQPADDASGAATFQVEVVKETGFERADLAQVDLLILMDVALISPRLAERVQSFVEDGGGLLVFLGDKTRPKTLNDLLWKGGAGVLPAEILEIEGGGPDDAPAAISLVDAASPPMAYFSEPRILPALTVPLIYSYYATHVPEEAQGVRVLAEFQSSDAATGLAGIAIAEKTSGLGRTILVTTSGDRSWNDIPILPTYVPLVRELSYHLVRREESLDNVLVGAPWMTILRQHTDDVIVSRSGERLQVIKPVPVDDGRGWEVRLPPLERAGIYRIVPTVLEGEVPDPAYVAVNVDTRESDLARIDRDFLQSSFAGDTVRWVDDPEGETATGPEGGSGSLWWPFLLVAAILLLAETAFSQIIGSRRGGGAA